MAPFTKVQRIAIAVTPKIPSFFSMIGSLYIIWDVLNASKRSKRTTYHRLLLGLSVCDIFFSIGMFLSTWAIPRGTRGPWGAVGNTQTCTMQGLLIQIGNSGVLYNGSLGFYYLLAIQKGWSANQMVRAEPYMHALPILWGTGTSIASLALKLFNPRGWVCHIAPLPRKCRQSWQSGSHTNCIRGDNASLYTWIFGIAPKWISIFLVSVFMIMVHRAVLQKEKATARFDFARQRRRENAQSSVSRDSVRSSVRSSLRYSLRSSISSTFDRRSTISNTFRRRSSDLSSTDSKAIRVKKNMKMSKRIAKQNYLYVGALYITNIGVLIVRLSEMIHGKAFFPMFMIVTILLPGQGFWNALVYLRPRYLAVRRKQKKKRVEMKREGFQPPRGRLNSNLVQALSRTVQKGDLLQDEQRSSRSKECDRYSVQRSSIDADEEKSVEKKSIEKGFNVRFISNQEVMETPRRGYLSTHLSTVFSERRLNQGEDSSMDEDSYDGEDQVDNLDDEGGMKGAVMYFDSGVLHQDGGTILGSNIAHDDVNTVDDGVLNDTESCIPYDEHCGLQNDMTIFNCRKNHTKCDCDSNSALGSDCVYIEDGNENVVRNELAHNHRRIDKLPVLTGNLDDDDGNGDDGEIVNEAADKFSDIVK